MKNTFKYALTTLSVAIMALSCQKAQEVTAPEQGSKLVTLTCEFPSMQNNDETKVSFAGNGTTQWQAGDKLIIFGEIASEKVVHTLTSGEITDPKKAKFTEDLTGVTPSKWGKYHYNVAYPYDEENVPFTSSDTDDSGRARFHNTNQMLMAGYIDNDNCVILYNLNAAILFKVSGDFDSYKFLGKNGTEIVGYGNYLCEMNSSSPVYRKKYLKDNGTADPLTIISGKILSNNGSGYNYIYLPVNNSDEQGDDATAVALPNGFTIQFLKGGVIKKTITSKAGITMLPGHFIDLGLLPSDKMKDYEAIPAAEKATATELSNPQSANCYVVDGGDNNNAGKVFKFPAVQGNTYIKGSAAGTSVGTVASVDFVWETWNNNETVTANSVVKIVDYKDGFVYFKMPSTLHAGNALIAAKDADGTILWSWHIWVPADKFKGAETPYNANTFSISTPLMMSRNLGALVDAAAAENEVDVRSFGLMYQWGRKDPFMGPGKVATNTAATMNARIAFSRPEGQISIATSIANPTQFAYYSGDWVSPSDNDLWGDVSNTKTIYDPCPTGYKVPKRDVDGNVLFKTADLTTVAGWESNATYHWFTVGSPKTVFPICGYYYYNGKLDHVADRTLIWNSHKSDDASAYTQFYNDGATTKNSYKKAYAGVIRCVAE